MPISIVPVPLSRTSNIWGALTTLMIKYRNTESIVSHIDHHPLDTAASLYVKSVSHPAKKYNCIVCIQLT